MSEEFKPGEIVICDCYDGNRIEIGEVKRRNPNVPNHYFVYYSTGDTAASTDASYLRRVEKRLCIQKEKKLNVRKRI